MVIRNLITYHKSIYRHGEVLLVQETLQGSTSRRGRMCYSKRTVCTRTAHLTSSCPQVIAYTLDHPSAPLLSLAMARSSYLITNICNITNEIPSYINQLSLKRLQFTTILITFNLARNYIFGKRSPPTLAFFFCFLLFVFCFLFFVFFFEKKND